MKSTKSFSLSKRLKSFVFAFNGLKLFLRTEHNSWIHILAATSIVILGILLKIKNTEWPLIAIAIGIVFIAEIFNTAIEKLTDIVTPNYNEKAKLVKDISAAAVLIAAAISIIIAIFVFYDEFIILIS